MSFWDRVAVALDEPPATVVAPCSPREAYLGAAADIRPLLLTGRRDLVAHVIGMEEVVLRWARGERVHLDDHREVRSMAAIDEWDDLVRAVAAIASDDLLIMRTFELWTHAQDLTGRVPATDPARLSVMSSSLAAMLPVAMKLRGVEAPGRTARLVLTGIAPACFDVPLAVGAEPGEPDVTIVADVVDVCRIAARRLPSVRLDAVFDGDEALGRTLLAAADAFAQD